MIWDWARGKRVHTFNAEHAVPQVDFDPTRPRVVLTGSDGLAEVWDLESGERVTVLAGPSGGVKDLAFRPDGSRTDRHREPRRPGAAVPTRTRVHKILSCEGPGAPWRASPSRCEARLLQPVRRCPGLGSRHR